MIFEFLLSVAIILLLHYIFLLSNKDYWKKRGVFCPKSDSLLGNLQSQYNAKRNLCYELHDFYEQYKNKYSYIGIYNLRSPRLLLLDPELIKDFLIKYFRYFQATELTNKIDEKSDPLFGNHSFFLVGDAWKKKRAQITVAFSNSRMKALYPTMKESIDKAIGFIRKQSKIPSSYGGLDAKDISSRYTMAVVCSSIYSVDPHTFEPNEKSVILQKIQSMLIPGIGFKINHIATSIYPFLSKFFKVAFCKPEAFQFFRDLMDNAVKHRVNSKIDRADYLDYLINLLNKKEISMKDVAAHGASFLTDGFETSSVGISCILYEIGKNKTIQNKMRAEIMTAMPNDEDVCYDKIMELPYLDQVWNEALRLHPPLPMLPKMCNEATDVDMRDGKTMHFEKDSVLYIPLYSLHLDDRFYDDPLTFKPERFNPEFGGVKAYKEKGVYLPFGDGPRICVGNRFATVQSKIGLVHILRNFEVSVNKKTADKFEIIPQSILTEYTTPFYIDFKDIKTKNI